MIEKAVKYLKNVSKKIGILFHDDVDGVCSGALIYSLIKERKPELYTGNMDIETFKKFSKKDFDAAIFLDFPCDEFKEFKKMFKNKKVLIIDHHPIIEDLNKYFIHINPRFKNPDIYISASKVCYNICKEAGLKDYEWLMNLGEVGDSVLKGFGEYKEAADMISAIVSIKGQNALVKLAKFFSNCRRLEDFVYKNEYQKIKIKFDREIKKQIEKFEKYEIEDINFFEVKSRYHIASSVINAIFDKYPYKTIVTFTKSNDHYKISGRSHRVDIGSAFRKASKGIGNGGGHERAAGARIKLKHLNKFKKRLIEVISSS